MPETLETPFERLQAYNKGLIGAYLPDYGPDDIRKIAQYERDKFNDECEVKAFATVFPAIQAGISKGKRFFAWENYYKAASAKATKGKQKTGDCVSWAKRTSVECTRTNEAKAGYFQYLEHGATALVYRSRGHNGEGMSGDQAARTVQQHGILFEKEYLDGKYDFRDYNEYVKWAMNGRAGIPSDLSEITRQTRIEKWARINDCDELADSIAAGYPPDCCSNLGVSSSSDQNGLSVRRGSWSHDMSTVGVDDTKEIFPRRVFIWDQSWGLWNNQKTPLKYKEICQQLGIEMPEGYFILDDDDTYYAIKQGGTIACSSTVGFPDLKLTDLGALGHI